MGGSASLCCPGVGRKVVSAFVDETLIEGESILKVNAVMRRKFVEYIKGDDWVDSLTSFEDNLSTCSALSESTWKKFGYKIPCFSGSRSSKSSLHKGESSTSLYTVEPEMEAPSSSSQVYGKKVMDDCYTAISTSLLFMKEEIPSILIAALLPLFLKSAECTETGDNSGWNSDKEDEEEEEFTVNICAQSKVAIKRTKAERLQEWFLGAAAMFDGSELDAYMSDVTVSWIDDYLRAIHNLPVTVTLSAVDPVLKESKIVFANDSRCGFFGCKSQVGENIHDVYGASCYPGGADQVSRAVFTARKYKRSLQEANGMCRLRALKPVHDTCGRHVYALGLESYLFEDPSLQERYAVLDEEPFQQIEDLLLMLPMLVRNFNSAELHKK